MRSVIVVGLLLLLGACGYQLRGTADVPFSSIYLDRAGETAVGAGVQRALKAGSKTRLSTRPDDAEAVLRIVSENTDKRILTLSSNGRVREYLLTFRVAFQLKDGAGKDILPPQQIELQRDFTYDDSRALAKESEEALLVRDMQNDVVQEILRRLRTARTG